MLLTAGERMSAALLAMAIHDQGLHARSLTGSQAGIITTGTHGNARIIDITPGRITTALDQGDIVIVAGFQGVAQDTKDVTTLGRGASDTTAVALAASLGADYCEIYSDVDGVFTADPRIVAERAADPGHQLRRDAGDGGLRGQDPASALRRIRPPRERTRSRPVIVLRQARHLDRRSEQRRTRWNRRSSPASRTTAAKPRSPSSGCRTRLGLRRGSSRRSPAPRSTST